MGYTNETTHYGIPLPLGSDLTTPMDYNTAAEAVDAAVFEAVSNSSGAVDTAAEAVQTANAASTTAAGAVTEAQTAHAVADAATTAAGTAQNTANAAQVAAADAQDTANAVTTKVNGFIGAGIVGFDFNVVQQTGKTEKTIFLDFYTSDTEFYRLYANETQLTFQKSVNGVFTDIKTWQ